MLGSSKAYAYLNGERTDIVLLPIGDGFYMRADAAGAFNRMRADASESGVLLKVNSAFRTMEQQTTLYSKYQQEGAPLAARPGYSKHQAGLAVDISVNDSTVRDWLMTHGFDYGFAQSVRSEPWHWEFRV